MSLKPLVQHYLKLCRMQQARPNLELSQRACAALVRESWPGNLRQLRNALERALLGTRGAEIDPERPRGSGETPARSLAEVEVETIRAALAAARGNQGRAAEILGISRKNLWEKRKRYGIP